MVSTVNVGSIGLVSEGALLKYLLRDLIKSVLGRGVIIHGIQVMLRCEHMGLN